MADAYTQLSSVASDTAAHEALAYFALRPQLYYDACADVKPTRQTHRGVSVTWYKYADLSAATSALTETADVDAVAMSDSTVTVTPAEYGNAILTTAKLRATSLFEVDADAANILGYNAGLTMDTLARTVLEAGTNVRYSGSATARNQVSTNENLTAANVRRARVDLAAANVMPYGNLYKAFIAPEIGYDLRSETGAASWRDPHTYSSPEAIWSGEIGAFEGFRFIETPRAPLFADAGDGSGGAGTVDVYGTLFMGQQALALAHGDNGEYKRTPSFVIRPPIDKLHRFHSIGWKWFGAYGRFREESLRRVESASTIGSNS